MTVMNYFDQETERLFFRRLTTNDQKSWEEFFIDNDRLHFLGMDVSKPHKQLAKEWIDRQLQRYKEEGTGLLAVIEKSSEEFIGMCGILHRVIEEKEEFEIGYSFKSKYWGNGYATEAAQQMKKFGIEAGIAQRFISIIHEDNNSSFRVAERNGMKPILNTEFMGMNVVVYGTDILKH